MDSKKIGAFIAELRKEKGLTQAALAEQLNISNRTVSKWENGDGYPDITSIPKLADILGITTDELLAGEPVFKSNSDNTKRVKTAFSIKQIIVIFLIIFTLCGITYFGVLIKNNIEFRQYGNLDNDINYIHTNLSAFNSTLDDIKQQAIEQELNYDGYMFFYKPDNVLLNRISYIKFSRDTVFFNSTLHEDCISGFVHCSYSELPNPNQIGFREINSNDFSEEYKEQDDVYRYSHKGSNLFNKKPWYLLKPLGANWYYYEYHTDAQ